MTFSSELPSQARRSIGQGLAGPALLAGAALVLVGAGAALGTRAAPPVDPCALPPGAPVARLDARDAALVTRHLLACNDLRHGRISSEQYRATIAATETPGPLALAPAGGRLQWASTLRGFSTQYTATDWSARQVLGPPDVERAGRDDRRAWASLGADDRDEWLEVAFAQPVRATGVELHETFNPGAVERVELIGASGKRYEARSWSDRRGPAHRLSVGCTPEPIVAARVHVASTKVAGWNEIDAIGLVACAR